MTVLYIFTIEYPNKHCSIYLLIFKKKNESLFMKQNTIIQDNHKAKRIFSIDRGRRTLGSSRGNFRSFGYLTKSRCTFTGIVVHIFSHQTLMFLQATGVRGKLTDSILKPLWRTAKLQSHKYQIIQKVIRTLLTSQQKGLEC
mmetsp:Transcript_17124/g.21869  ORF Transcript_17124/g.21869 Transcript_17124/m.21869 type:complete len:142 (-) Transcript_17124:874-1299(-)